MSQASKTRPSLDQSWGVVDEVKVGAPKARTSLMRRPPRSRNRISPVPAPRSSRPRARGWRSITAGDAVDYGYKAYTMAKNIARLINVEEKIFDVDGTASATTVTSTPLVVNLSNIAQGTDFFNRIGNSIRPLSLRIAYSSFGNSATIGSMMRLLIVQDKENQGVDPTLGDVLAGLSQPILAPPNPETGRRFKILHDMAFKYQSIPDLATAGTSTSYIGERKDVIVVDIPMRGHIYYDDTAGADASNLEGALFLMAASIDPVNGPGLRYTSRLVFTDN